MTVFPEAHCVHRPHWSLARTWLLEPARPGCQRALASEADVVVLDIEDGLPDSDKPAGRRAVAECLDGDGQAWVRISSAGTPNWNADLDAVAGVPGLSGVILAKVESAHDVVSTAQRLPAGTPVVALIESALGIESALEIARSCARIAFGIGDFRRDTGMCADPMVLAYPRARLVIASRAAGLPAPIDGPTLRDNAGDLPRDTEIAKAAGMTGRLCLDAGHAGTINTLLSPSLDEIDAARAILARLDAPSSHYDGSSGPTRARAEAILDLAAKLGVLSDSPAALSNPRW
ncbi:CoA ester lyase [Mycobacterium sp. PSTR-4-N]|uniref:HpcH/HpaI aldolase/citrate lyase family protein n=1 Tax=Mycobacterium sp. PSTR-4-N TaxID=2917745 RepID=UPI001F153582|nr:aldolase/citrate lyase family protein [Mycobacterium sp. PSTR-4-N]MCG7593622.1 aldolase/citrate lyase family protein [Mycobacterium sp. PSTR-4-N]